MIGSIDVKIMGEDKTLTSGLTYFDLIGDYQDQYKYPILLAKVGNIYKELSEYVSNGEVIEFVDLKNPTGNKVYVNGLILVLEYAVNNLFGHSSQIAVKYSIDKGIYITTNFKLTKKKVDMIKSKMLDIVHQNLSITRCGVTRKEAKEYFNLRKDKSKVDLYHYNTNSYVTLYKLGSIYDFFFSLMPIRTGVLKEFDLHYLDEDGFVLLFPTIYIDGIKPYEHHPQLFEVFNEYQKWANMMKISNVPDLNKVVSNGRADDIIRIEETLQSNRLLNIAKTIVSRKNEVKIILIAGPSSSGKTTSCKKLSMYLRSFGLEPREMSMDDYFVDRELTPKDENGEYDFECLEAIDVKHFDKDVKDLLNGKGVKLPTFNFLTGKQEPGTKETFLGKNEVLIIEGIHALNEKILTSIDRKTKFKIYLSPLTILTIDTHNRISTTDNRLLRRIVRDNRTRGNTVEDTIRLWRKVRMGEELHIFPNQDAADVVYNTALIYELGVLKTYVEPLLYSVPSDSPQYETARRLLNMLKTFLPIPSDAIPEESLLREFIGGSCFK